MHVVVEVKECCGVHQVPSYIGLLLMSHYLLH